MTEDFSRATIRELIMALDAVERSIQRTRLFVPETVYASGPDSIVNPRLVELAEQEQQITHELAFRRTRLTSRRDSRPAVR